MQKNNHKIRINIADENDEATNVIESETKSISKRLFRKLFDKKRKVLIIAPADIVTEVEILEKKDGG